MFIGRRTRRQRSDLQDSRRWSENDFDIFRYHKPSTDYAFVNVKSNFAEKTVRSVEKEPAEMIFERKFFV